MSVLDFIGLRLTAMPLLPLKSILYGSDDSMKSVNADSIFHRTMMFVAADVHLGLHYIGKKRKARLFTAGDVEGHSGKDGRHYIIDTARFFPPECPVCRQDLFPRGTVPLYRLLRPEFLQTCRNQWKKSGGTKLPPLSADVWTGWSDWNEEDQTNNREATYYLFTTSIYGVFVRDLKSFKCYFSIPEVHKKGVNVRHMGLVRKNVSEDIRNQILIQMVARSIKNEFRDILRGNAEAGKSIAELQQLILDELNMLTGAEKVLEIQHWEEFTDAILLRFGTECINPHEQSELNIRFVDHIHKKGLLDAAIENILIMSAIVYSAGFDKPSEYRNFSFTPADLHISTRSKQFDTMDYALANMFQQDAKRAKKKKNLMQQKDCFH